MSGITDILRSVAPTIATALGGPLAGAAVSFLASKFGVDPALVEQTVAGMTPSDLVKMKELDLDFQKHMADNGIAIQLAQIETNKVEAANTSWFVAGWRPAVGWICAAALGYAAIIEPMARFTAAVGFKYVGAFPVIDTVLTLQILLGMLGLGSMRSLEKVKSVEGNR